MIELPFFSKKRVTVDLIKTVALNFTTDHAIMKNNSWDWSYSGQTFPKPAFTYGNPSAPITHTKNTKMQVDVDLEVWPLNADSVDCNVVGTAPFLGVNFVTRTSLKGGRQTISLESDRPLPDKVAKCSGNISWDVDVSGQHRFHSDDSWGHTVFLTMDMPDGALQALLGRPALPEDGATLKRMEKAIELVGRARSNDPHAIAASLMSLVPGYILEATGTPQLQAVGHPGYHNTDKGGAWALADHLQDKAQCQAIVRFVRGVLRQIGCPGTIEQVHVWEDPPGVKRPPPVKNYSSVANIYASTDPRDGLQFVTHPQNISWLAFLADTPIQPADVNRKIFSYGTIGLNQFEACLRLDHGGVVKYYAGGTTTPAGTVGTFDTPEQVLQVFQSLIYIEKVSNGFIVRQIIKKYR